MTLDDNELEALGAQLHTEWDSPALWPRIAADLAVESRKANWGFLWRMAIPALAFLVLTVALLEVFSLRKPENSDNAFLTKEALREVEQTEAAYARSVEKLAAVADTSLNTSFTPLAAAYREKLLILDAAIADLKTHVDSNQYNIYLRSQLASLYREKQATLEEWLKNAKDH